jgi:hypothetical protein
MPRRLSRATRRAVFSDSLIAIDGLEISTEPPYDVFDYRFVNDRLGAVYGGVVFQPVGFTLRGVESSSGQAVDRMEFEMDDVGRFWSRMTRVRSLTGMRVRAVKTYPGVTTRVADFPVLFDGYLGGPTFDGTKMKAEIRSILAYRDTIVPRRMYEPGCTRLLGDAGCGVDMDAPENYRQFSVASGSSRYEVRGGVEIGQAPGYWAEGYVRVVAGPNIGLVRPVATSVPGKITLRVPFDMAPEGAVVEVRRGCRRTKNDCDDRYDNLDNYGGFAEVPVTPAIDQVVSKVPAPSTGK